MTTTQFAVSKIITRKNADISYVTVMNPNFFTEIMDIGLLHVNNTTYTHSQGV